MTNYTTLIEQFLDNSGLHYCTEPFEDGSDTIVRFSDDDGTTIDVHVVNNGPGCAPALAVISLLRVPADKAEAARRQAKEDDAASRYFCYDVDDDNDLNLSYQFHKGLTDDEVLEVLQVIFPVFVLTARKTYQAYSRLIWA